MAVVYCARCGHSLTPEQTNTPCPNCGSLDRTGTDSEEWVVKEKAEVAKELAKKHYEVEAGLTSIFRITGRAEDEPSEPIKLLEVNENTAPSGIMPLHFGPAPASGILYPSIIVEITPDEFQRIQSRELKLPDGWEIGEELPKPLATAGDA